MNARALFNKNFIFLFRFSFTTHPILGVLELGVEIKMGEGLILLIAFSLSCFSSACFAHLIFIQNDRKIIWIGHLYY